MADRVTGKLEQRMATDVDWLPEEAPLGMHPQTLERDAPVRLPWLMRLFSWRAHA